ncbi:MULTISPECIES: flagellar motor switch protein FliM [Clostridium]|uniref:Flagellar motor switch protein FliM n=1 Tax=Clostridium paridis TaxID=2803863 RepID=A0A937FIE4_9CLOT|nr:MULTISPECIES: flagellar motor switch protein FliM [Clostridium]MBL4932897.1 flagellar motor switch protein FliM [Clostridium paridis]
MAEVLSQSEIDALLSALSTGELQPEELQKDEEKQKVKLYDFRSPQKFSKEHIRTLELIHDNYARIISNYLSGQLRKNVKVKIETVEQITYEEFIHSVSNPTILTIFTLAPLSGSILFETNPQFVYQVLDILLGGDGERKLYTAKEFTDIDKNIIQQVNAGLISNLKLAWEDLISVEPAVDSIETNPALNQTLAPTEPVALIVFSVELGKSNCFINLCIPYLSLEKVLDKLVVQYWFRDEGEGDKEESKKKVLDRLNNVDVSMHVELGKTHLMVDDFLKLVNGDIVKLDNKFTEPVKVFVENEVSYIGKPGVIGKKAGVAILDILEKDVGNDE